MRWTKTGHDDCVKYLHSSIVSKYICFLSPCVTSLLIIMPFASFYCLCVMKQFLVSTYYCNPSVEWLKSIHSRTRKIDLKPSFPCQLEDKLSASMWKAWCDIRWGLTCNQPKSERTWLSQCILWNPCIINKFGQLLLIGLEYGVHDSLILYNGLSGVLEVILTSISTNLFNPWVAGLYNRLQNTTWLFTFCASKLVGLLCIFIQNTQWLTCNVGMNIKSCSKCTHRRMSSIVLRWVASCTQSGSTI